MTDRHGQNDRPEDDHVADPYQGPADRPLPHEAGGMNAPGERPAYAALLAGHDAGDGDEPFGDEGAHAARAEGVEGKARRRRGFAVLGVAVALLLAGVVLAFSIIAPMVGGFFESKDYDGPGSGRVPVVVKEGDSGQMIGQTLVSSGVVKTTEAFTEALAAQPGDEIQPGHYVLAKEMKASDALSALRGGGARNEKTVTVREGMRAIEVFEQASKVTGVPVSDYEAASKNTAALGLPAAVSKGSVEGFLYPATYTFAPGTSAKDQLKQMVGTAVSRMAALGVKQSKMRETVTVASIVEAEARLPQDRPKIAAVIENRLKEPMRLQLDSTVAYGVGKRTITTTDQERADPNPYNTYVHDGLPAGPINNPGEDAVKAALKPAAGDWLYFVAINPETGETAYASTLAEHNANVRKFQSWCQANPGKC